MKIQSLSDSAKIKVALLLLVLFLFAFTVFFKKDSETKTVYHKSIWNDYVPEIERAVKLEASMQSVNLKHIYGGVVSHHIPTTIPQLAEFYIRLKKTQPVKNFIVVGVDHVNAGRAPITISNANIFPSAKVTPIIMRSDTTKDHAEALGKILATFVDEETVVIASVDFSHYLSTDQAMPLDRVSGEVIRNLDLAALTLVKADSDKSTAVFMRAMSEKEAVETDSLKVLNTNDLMQNSDYTTGYVFGYWGKK